MSEAGEIWTAVAQLLRAQLNEAVWYSTFQDVVPIDTEADVLRVRVPNSLVRDKIHTRYLPLITGALEEIGAAHRRFEIEVRSEQTMLDLDSTLDPSLARLAQSDEFASSRRFDTIDRAGVHHAAPASTEHEPSAGLNPRYTFETFVKGSSNQFALAASLRVAEVPGRSYNPLFIYGAAGLGKTHLLQAIGHYVRLNYQHHVVRYISTENFLNEFIDAIRLSSTAAFKRRYREVDVLLVDDIQFIENRERVQEEFFHTFNSLHGANKQIVISCDRTPDAMQTLEERLRGRFKWGLITDIQPPDLETRVAILRNKAERDAVTVPNETLEFIAANISSNIRELEGALIRVTAFSSLNHVSITTELAEKLLSDLLVDAKPKQRTDAELLEAMAEILGFSVESLQGKSRQRPLVTSRQIAMYAFRDLTELSYPAIARLFGGRDHTTVIHAVDKVQRLMRERKQIYDQVHELLTQLKSA
ncbi:MAG: chromosomal replication initiator protein DnaA [Actinomycetota bacterium]|nr:chromosomal replication initiator protein DnaA [Actinomycetota bacterium]